MKHDKFQLTYNSQSTKYASPLLPQKITDRCDSSEEI